MRNYRILNVIWIATIIWEIWVKGDTNISIKNNHHPRHSQRTRIANLISACFSFLISCIFFVAILTSLVEVEAIFSIQNVFSLCLHFYFWIDQIDFWDRLYVVRHMIKTMNMFGNRMTYFIDRLCVFSLLWLFLMVPITVNIYLRIIYSNMLKLKLKTYRSNI